VLSATFVAALVDAERYHHFQVRKSTNIPYFSHLMVVSGLVLDAGGSETEAIAALLHDAPEDCGGAPVLAEIEAKFGSDVGAIVAGCSDAFPLVGEEKPPFRARKEAYIAHLRGASASTMLVSAADKLHNLRSIQADYDVVGDAIFDRFSAPVPKRQNVLWCAPGEADS
jgi:(p)ppGpp synthase/HD superfamily hydrolase